MSGYTNIGGISNYYGGLRVKTEDGKFFWSIEDVTEDDWEEIPESLYLELMRFNDKTKGT